MCPRLRGRNRKIVLGEKFVEAGAGNAGGLAGFFDIVAALQDEILQVSLFERLTEFLEFGDAAVEGFEFLDKALAAISLVHRITRHMNADVGRQMSGVEFGLIATDCERAVNGVDQLTDVTGPGIGLQSLEKFRRKSFGVQAYRSHNRTTW